MPTTESAENQMPENKDDIVHDEWELHRAASLNSVDNAYSAIGRGVRLDAKSLDLRHTPLHAAAIAGSADVARLLIQHGATVDPKDDYGRTPLYYAAGSDLVDMALLLIDGGADVHMVSPFVVATPLQAAAIAGSIDLIHLLLDNGADVNDFDFNDEDGCTPLCYAVKNGSLELIHLLLDNGAEVDFNDEDGCTPLCYAVKNGSLELTRLLLDRGADVNEFGGANVNGLSTYSHPLYHAEKSGSLELVRLLKESGAFTQSIFSEDEENTYFEEKDAIAQKLYEEDVVGSHTLGLEYINKITDHKIDDFAERMDNLVASKNKIFQYHENMGGHPISEDAAQLDAHVKNLLENTTEAVKGHGL